MHRFISCPFNVFKSRSLLTSSVGGFPIRSFVWIPETKTNLEFSFVTFYYFHLMNVELQPNSWKWKFNFNCSSRAKRQICECEATVNVLIQQWWNHSSWNGQSYHKRKQNACFVTYYQLIIGFILATWHAKLWFGISQFVELQTTERLQIQYLWGM